MNKGSYYILIQSVMIGIISIFTNALYRIGFDPYQTSAIRVGFSAVFFLLYAVVRCRTCLKVKIKDLWMFAIAGIGLMLVSSLYMHTIASGGAAVAAILLYTEPMIVMIASAYLFKERITPLRIVSLILTFIGILLISGILGDSVRVKPIVFMTGIGSAVAYSFFTIFNRIALNKTSMPWYLAPH